MKNLLEKMKKTSFWLSLGGAVVLVLQCLGVKISAPVVNEVISAVCSVFVVIGIMDPAESKAKNAPESEIGKNDDSSENDGITD